MPPGPVLPPGVQGPPGRPLPPGYQFAYPGLLVQPRPHGLPLAPLGLRLLARLIDIAVVLALNVVGNGWLIYLYLSDVSPVVRALYRQMQQANRDTSALPPIPGRATWLYYVIPVIAMALWFAYEVPAIAHSGQTFGKRIVGIKVMGLESDEPIGLGRAWRRWNPLGLPVLLWSCGLGFLLQFVDAISTVMGGPLHLALHDRAAHTVVVQSGRRGHETAAVPDRGADPDRTGGQP
jgi:uncharacterized RDD family membrane protein YckC